MTSKNILDISVAIFLLIKKLHATTPPNALIGSDRYASLKDFIGELFIEAPDGLACLIITTYLLL